MPSRTPAEGAAVVPSIITVRLRVIALAIVTVAVVPIRSVIAVGSDTAVVPIASDTAVVPIAPEAAIVPVASMDAMIGVMPMHIRGDSMSSNGTANVTELRPRRPRPLESEIRPD